MTGHYLLDSGEDHRVLVCFVGPSPYDWLVWYKKQWRGTPIIVDWLCPGLRSHYHNDNWYKNTKKIKSGNLLDFYKAIL